MDFRDSVFLKVAENLSFSKASKELFISQPAVTKHIKQLEENLKTALFYRRGNKIQLTKSGELTYKILKKVEGIYEELSFEIGLLNNSFKGTLKIGASSTISQYLIPKVIAAFHKRYPKIELFIYNGNSFEMEEKLLNNEIDIALVENEMSNSNLKYNDFFDDEIVVVTSNKSVYSKRKHLAISDFYEIPIVLREKGSGTLQVIRNSFNKSNILLEKLNILIHLGSTEAIKNFLIDFEGIAFVSEKAIDKEIQLKELVKLKVKNFNIYRMFRISQRKEPISSSSKLFIDFLNNYNL